MTIEEYNKERDRLRKEYSIAIDNLTKEYAKTNSPYSVGRIVKTKKGKIARIIELRVSVYTDKPVISYKCENITKKGTVNKNEPIVYIGLHEIANEGGEE